MGVHLWVFLLNKVAVKVLPSHQLSQCRSVAPPSPATTTLNPGEDFGNGSNDPVLIGGVC